MARQGHGRSSVTKLTRYDRQDGRGADFRARAPFRKGVRTGKESKDGRLTDAQRPKMLTVLWRLMVDSDTASRINVQLVQVQELISQE